jgi:hypothetical protein
LELTLTKQEVHAFISFLNYFVSSQKFPGRDKLIISSNVAVLNFLDEIVIRLSWDRINFPLKTLSASLSIILSKIDLEIKRNNDI